MIQYKIVEAPSTKLMEERVQKMLEEGWGFVGNLISINQPKVSLYAREMVKEVKELTEPTPVEVDPDVIDQEFKVRYNKVLGDKTRDLLYINGIVLDCNKGVLTTSYKGETKVGISPVHVLNLLKNSKHFPINTDEKQILNELEGLV